MILHLIKMKFLKNGLKKEKNEKIKKKLKNGRNRRGWYKYWINDSNYIWNRKKYFKKGSNFISIEEDKEIDLSMIEVKS